MQTDVAYERFLSGRTRVVKSGEREHLLRMAEKTEGVISLGRGDPDLPTPAHIVEAGARALKEGYTHYSHWAGSPRLREAIAEKLKRENGLPVDPGSEVVVTTGAQEAIYVTFQALLDAGDEVLIPDPHYTSYTRAVALADGVAVMVPTHEERGFEVDPAELESRITPRTKAIVVVSPSNPTAAVLSRETVERIAELAVKHGLLVISDEIYEKMLWDGRNHFSVTSIPGMKERTVVINGFSKSFAMTGWRVGYLAAPAPIIRAMESIKHSLTICAPMVSQMAALAALKGPQDCIEEMRAIYDERRLFFMNVLTQAGLSFGYPAGSFYIFANIRPTGFTSFDFCRCLLQDARVLVFPGTVYGNGEGFVRISLLQPMERLQEAARRLQAAVRRYIESTEHHSDSPGRC